MKPTQPEPLLRTSEDQFNKVEQYKLASNGTRGELHAHFRDATTQDIVDASEQLAKSHGIYLEYNRALSGREKDWMYMIQRNARAGRLHFTTDKVKAFEAYLTISEDRMSITKIGLPCRTNGSYKSRNRSPVPLSSQPTTTR